MYHAAMGPSRDQVDLWLIIETPDGARAYINNFDWSLPKEWRPHIAKMDDGREIDLNNMSDDDAMSVARFLLRNIQVKAAEREYKLTQWDQ